METVNAGLAWSADITKVHGIVGAISTMHITGSIAAQTLADLEKKITCGAGPELNGSIAASLVTRRRMET
ncbi:hypothetical protein CHS0354_020706, partial [Potamilus streckersoni]